MKLKYLTDPNIDNAQSLFDLMVLVWREIKDSQGPIRTTMEQLEARENIEAVATESRFHDAVCHAWSHNPGLAGNKLIDDGIRTVLRETLAEYEPTRVLTRLLSKICERANDIHRGTPGPLNAEFREIACVYLGPLMNLAPKGLEFQPPDPFAIWPPATLPDFSIVPAEPTDIRIEFDDPGIARLGVPQTELRIGIADYCCDRDRLTWTVLHEANGMAYSQVHVEPAADADQRVRETIEMMQAHGVHVGVMPELSMLPELVEAARTALQESYDAARGESSLRLLVAGTVHETVTSTRVRNVARVFAADGSELWTQDKLSPYAWPDGKPEYQEALDTSDRVLHVCDLWIGRTIVTICLDYLADSVQALAHGLSVGCFLVPAMTQRTTDFGNRAFDNVRASKAGTFVANASCQAADTHAEESASLGVFPRRGSRRRIVHEFDLTDGPVVHIVPFSPAPSA